jgi:hypothetical protein
VNRKGYALELKKPYQLVVLIFLFLSFFFFYLMVVGVARQMLCHLNCTPALTFQSVLSEANLCFLMSEIIPVSVITCDIATESL